MLTEEMLPSYFVYIQSVDTRSCFAVTCQNKSSSLLYVQTISDEFRCFNKLIELWSEIQQLPENRLDIKVDFHYCEFLGHNGVAFLGGLVRLVESRGGRVTFDWDTLPKNIHVNLAQNGFLHDFGCNQEPWDGNSIPYQSHLDHNPEAIADYLRYKWLRQGWINISPGLQHAIVGRVSEIYLNAFEHSDSVTGVFSCGQNYPKAGTLQLTVIDFGIGIPTSVRSLPQNSALTTTEALEWAFRLGTSTKQNGVCRGTGLNLLQTFVSKNHGNLTIFSNDGYVNISDNGVDYKNINTNFAGTLINIALRCDESYYCLASEICQDKKQLF